ncbi:MAG TPA: hypothetical protein VEJ18_20495, partial [Planctomycetota bacterium]|nr:hypothetical protein [Planctomycetota bacterium]
MRSTFKALLGASLLATGAADGAPSGLPARAPFECCVQQPPTPPKPPQTTQAEREKKAQSLWDEADKLEKDGKFFEAQQKLRELRSRFMGTRFYFDKMEAISDRINELGMKLALGSLGKTKLYKRPHQDSWFGYEFSPPDGWKGVPPQALWFGEFDRDEVSYSGFVEQASRYTAPYLDKLYMTTYKIYDCKSLDFLEQKLLAKLEPRFKGLKEESKEAFQAQRGQALKKTYSTNDGDRLTIYYFFAHKKGLALTCVWRAGAEESFTMTITTIGPDGTRTTRKSSSDRPVTVEDYAHAQKIFDQCARTFWIYDQGTRSGMAVKLNRSALCSDWNVMKSSKGSYLIEYGTSTEYAKRCGDELEQILALYRQVIPSGKGIPQCRVKIFDREDDMLYYSGAYG